MNRSLKISITALSALMCTAGACCVYFIQGVKALLFAPIAVMIFFAGYFLAMICGVGAKSCRLFFLSWGTALLRVFYVALAASAVWHIAMLFMSFDGFWLTWSVSAVVCFIALAAVFWTGMILVYSLSVQMGLRHRAVGLLLGFVPIANLVMLGKIIRVSAAEYSFENGKLILNSERREKQICKTKYPLLLVHGVFFRDFKHINYWGRIPAELEANGAKIYYGEQNSAASVAESGRELKARIEQIVNETDCKKVNIIAHSKGGLDSISAIEQGAGEYVASLTTINTPHRGCEFADYLLKKAPENMKYTVSKAYNAAAAKLGDTAPDFLAAVEDLTAERCRQISDGTGALPSTVYTQSVMSKMNKPSGGKFPLNFTYLLAKHFDGEGDGLVAVENARFGESFTLVEPDGSRGISHGDMVDLNRENIPGFDVREFYVQLVADLKNKGL